MPATIDELATFIRGLLDGAIMPDTVPVWADGSSPTTGEVQEIAALTAYEVQRRLDQTRELIRRAAARHGHDPQRRAANLLRTLLTPVQQKSWAQRGCFDVEVPSGRRYRFWPNRRRVAQLERHGKRWYEKEWYCIHPPDECRLPDADETIAQLLFLSESEAAFLAEANAVPVLYDQLWNGDYLRQMRAAERERRAAPEGSRGWWVQRQVDEARERRRHPAPE